MVDRMEQMWKKPALAASSTQTPQAPLDDHKGTPTSRLQCIAAD
jgi:hypothetical protein